MIIIVLTCMCKMTGKAVGAGDVGKEEGRNANLGSDRLVGPSIGIHGEW